MNLKSFTLAFLSLATFLRLHATVTPNSLFTDHMVLQQGVTVPIWGTASEGETVTVKFAGQTKTAKTQQGKWMIKLSPLKAGGPFTISIKGENEITVSDVLVGEVWLCSGQSNMERQLGPRPPQKPLLDWEKERDAANYPQIREYYIPLKFSAETIADRNSKWEVCSPSTVSKFSAVGYYFAKHLYNNIKVPIGILFSAYGGTEAEHWTSRAALEDNPEFLKVVRAYDNSIKEFPAKAAEFQRDSSKLTQQFLADSAKAKADGSTLPKKPVSPADPKKGRMPSGLYNAMINPLLPYAIKGVCWYQGENNNGRPKQYANILSTLIAGWRKDFMVGDFPFLIVQIAPFRTIVPELREAQLQVSKKVKNTALIVTTDCGDSGDIHPANKQPVGERLALAARAIAYTQKIEYSGPVFQSAKFEKNNAILSFSHTGKGLDSKGEELTGFTIAAADSVFKPAKAVIRGNTVVVTADGIDKPVAVRYGWNNVPVVNLYNKEGLPASPFRSDEPK